MAENFSNSVGVASGGSTAEAVAENFSGSAAAASGGSTSTITSGGIFSATTELIPVFVTAITEGAGEVEQTLVLSGFPAGTTFSSGTPSAGGSEVSFSGELPVDFSFTVPTTFVGDFELSIVAMGETASADSTQTVMISPSLFTFLGGDGDDLLIGSDGNDILRGGNGNDELSGGAGNDAVNGGAGNDTLFGGAGDDFIVGLGGTDIIDGGSGSDTNSFQGIGFGVTAGIAADGSGTAQYGSVNETFSGIENLTGSANDDVLSAVGNADNVIRGLGGDDTLTGGGGNDSLFGNDGDDVLRGAGGDDILLGGDGDDDLNGGAGNDTLTGGDGDDLLIGQGGVDVINGGLGIDINSFAGIGFGVVATIFDNGGGTAEYGSVSESFLGIDVLSGTANSDTLTVIGSRATTLIGAGGNDILFGGSGDDFIVGGTGDDEIRGRGGNDRLFGAAGIDEIFGGLGDDELFGNLGNDILNGNAGADSLFGGDGDDDLFGNQDVDGLFGQFGDDNLFGGPEDTFVGGPGSDTIVDE